MILIGISVIMEGGSNMIYNQYKEDCTKDELFYPQSIITQAGYCRQDPKISFCEKVERCIGKED